MKLPIQTVADALALPVQDRAKLAHTLISSIDEKNETGVSSAWDVALKKRVREIREGKVRGVPAEVSALPRTLHRHRLRSAPQGFTLRIIHAEAQGTRRA